MPSTIATSWRTKQVPLDPLLNTILSTNASFRLRHMGDEGITLCRFTTMTTFHPPPRHPLHLFPSLQPNLPRKHLRIAPSLQKPAIFQNLNPKHADISPPPAQDIHPSVKPYMEPRRHVFLKLVSRTLQLQHSSGLCPALVSVQPQVAFRLDPKRRVRILR